jgi:hypothetical protein
MIPTRILGTAFLMRQAEKSGTKVKSKEERDEGEEREDLDKDKEREDNVAAFRGVSIPNSRLFNLHATRDP